MGLELVTYSYCAQVNSRSVTSQLDVVTLSSNVFPSCTIQNNCGNFFNLDSRFAKAGRRLGPFYMEVGVPGLVR